MHGVQNMQAETLHSSHVHIVLWNSLNLNLGITYCSIHFLYVTKWSHSRWKPFQEDQTAVNAPTGKEYLTLCMTSSEAQFPEKSIESLEPMQPYCWTFSTFYFDLRDMFGSLRNCSENFQHKLNKLVQFFHWWLCIPPCNDVIRGNNFMPFFVLGLLISENFLRRHIDVYNRSYCELDYGMYTENLDASFNQQRPLSHFHIHLALRLGISFSLLRHLEHNCFKFPIILIHLWYTPLTTHECT